MSDARPPAGKRGRGRPSMPPRERQSEMLKAQLRLKPDEYDEVCRRALREGKSLSLVARDLIRLGISVGKTCTPEPPGPILGARTYGP